MSCQRKTDHFIIRMQKIPSNYQTAYKPNTPLCNVTSVTRSPHVVVCLMSPTHATLLPSDRLHSDAASVFTPHVDTCCCTRTHACRHVEDKHHIKYEADESVFTQHTEYIPLCTTDSLFLSLVHFNLFPTVFFQHFVLMP